MANAVTITKILDGARSAVFHVFIKSDGASGELVDQVLIDPVLCILGLYHQHLESN